MFVHIVIALSLTSLSMSYNYRADYEYSKENKAFYKLHIEARSRFIAEKVCNVEGAELMGWNSSPDRKQARAMLDKYPDIGDEPAYKYAWVNDEDIGYKFIEHENIINPDDDRKVDVPKYKCVVTSRSGDLMADYCENTHIFFCKVEEKAVYYDTNCQVYGKNYQYYSHLGSCYGIPSILYTWNEAYAECNNEGAHLVVLNSEAEREVVIDIVKNSSLKTTVQKSKYIYAGFRARKSSDNKPHIFKTIFDQTLEEAGYSEWQDQEPNNEGGAEFCGTFFYRDGKLNDLNCYLHRMFVCEKEISTPQQISKVYRSDYEYNEKTDAFYKLHKERVSFQNAKEICALENARLMPSPTQFDISQLLDMLKKNPDFYGDVWINEVNINSDEDNLAQIDGISDEHQDNYDIGTPSLINNCHAMTREGVIMSVPCSVDNPFICKVEANDAPYDSVCDVYGTDYEYVKSIGSCYRVSRNANTWQAASADCQAQGSHLVVLNSEAEHNVVAQIIQNAEDVIEAYSPNYYIAGFLAHKPDRTFKTIFGQTLYEAGYWQWADTEPNNADGNEFCGSLYIGDGKLNDFNCEYKHGYICEKEKDF